MRHLPITEDVLLSRVSKQRYALLELRSRLAPFPQAQLAANALPHTGSKGLNQHDGLVVKGKASRSDHSGAQQRKKCEDEEPVEE